MQNETETISIIKCSEEKDLALGVIFDENLLFDSHIQSINKSNQMIGIIRRTFTYIYTEYFLTFIQSTWYGRMRYGFRG